MKLDAWLKTHNLKDPDFAAMIGRDRTTVYRLRSEATVPDWETLSAIVRVTDGEVTAGDFLQTYVEKQEAKGHAA